MGSSLIQIDINRVIFGMHALIEKESQRILDLAWEYAGDKHTHSGVRIGRLQLIKPLTREMHFKRFLETNESKSMSSGNDYFRHSLFESHWMTEAIKIRNCVWLSCDNTIWLTIDMADRLADILRENDATNIGA